MGAIEIVKGGWDVLLALDEPSKLPAGQVLNLADSALEVLFAFALPPRNTDLVIGLGVWNPAAGKWFPAAAGTADSLSPAVQLGRGSLKIAPAQGLSPGSYVVLNPGGEQRELQVWVSPYTPAGGAGGGGGMIAGAQFEAFTPGGNGVAAQPDAIVKSWDGTQLVYTGSFGKAPRPTTALLSASADYDATEPLTVMGTRFGKPVTDSLVPNPGNFTEGKVIFDSFTGWSRPKAATKGTTALGFGNALGLRALPQGSALVMIDDDIAKMGDYTLDLSQGGIFPKAGKVPDGKRTYRVLY
jgi:hypothetical protein